MLSSPAPGRHWRTYQRARWWAAPAFVARHRYWRGIRTWRCGFRARLSPLRCLAALCTLKSMATRCLLRFACLQAMCSYTCPVHVLYHAWKGPDRHAAAPGAWGL